ncbi:MAG TPA: methyl-accepting chemotaxis protein [Limnobacter sp.]|uniref:methyl-accepting chemotaxis protein n=1 Tax=Limnobacter sp. TaxID=2003368 RepID=UPI002E332288|nr:methyl-accepting chemotaxis protein [Limnobacter sp.]HEX5485004.1 methyl-accepting chemotaxis protein [Limnobacter sp.]
MNPIIRALGTLKLTHQFLLIAAPVTVAFALLFFNYYQTDNALIQASKDELVGAQNLPLQTQLMENIQRHMGLTALTLAGDDQFKAQLGSLEKTIQSELEHIKSQLPPAWIKTHASLAEVRSDWAALQSKNLTLKPTQNFRAHSSLLSKMIRSIRLAADESQLTLDPDVAGYYLMSPVNFSLPMMHAQLSTIQSALASMVANGSISGNSIGQSQAMLDANAVLARDVVDSLKKVTETGTQVPEKALAMADKLVKNTADIQTLINKIVDSPLMFTGAKVYKTIDPWLSDQTTTQNQINALLINNLQDRIARMQNDEILKSGEALFALLLATLTGIWVFRRIGVHVQCLKQQASELSKGNLTPVKQVTTQDELGQISESIETIRKQQNQIMLKIRQASEQLGMSTETLGSATEQVSAGASAQADSAASVASSVEELSVSVSQVAEYANQAFEMAKNTGEASNSGQIKMQCTQEAIAKIADSSSELAIRIDNLGQRSNGISSIVQTIQAIAEQTNLLALNAAIEAARAGEHGKGFAVVADEVRKLSEKTAQSTESISELVTGIQQEALKAVDSVQGWKDKIRQSLEDSAKASEGMQQIQEHSQVTERAVQEINEALSEQTSASTMIAQKVEKIAQMTEESSSAAQQVSAVSQEVRHTARDLQELLARFSLDKSAELG